MTQHCSGTHAVPVGLVGLVVALAIVGSGPGSSDVARAAPAAAFPTTFSIRIDARGRGTFQLSGGLVDAGRAMARRSVVNGRLNATTTLSGAKGRIVLTSRQACVGGVGTWRVVSGTLAYASLSGRGTLAGRGICRRPLGAAAFVLRGTGELPPPALADQGAWGGTTGQAGVVTFTVAPDGRSVTSVRVTRYRYECLRSDGLRTTVSSPTESRFAGPFPIAEDRTFTVKTFDGTLAGRFDAARAAGTITVASTSAPNAQGQTTTCSGSIPWTATNPPGPPPQALAGTYCGFTASGGGVCVDVAAGGREARNLRAEVKLSCGIVAKIPVSVAVSYDRPMTFALDLSFRQSFEQPFEGKALAASVSGTFDENGVLLGSVGVSPFNVERDGRTHLCRTSGGFTARLQR